MAYVGRNTEGKIIAYSPSGPAPGIAEEYIDDNDPELLEYLNPPAPPYTLSIETFWGRMTDEEAEDFDAAIASSPVRLRRMFNAATSLTEGTELFLFVLDKLTTLFGEERALQIIAQDMSRPVGEETATL